MERIEVVFLDQTGAKQIRAKIGWNVPVKTIIPTIITKMSLPATAPDGTPMSYSLDHKEAGKRLREDDTLPGAGVMTGDHLIVYPEIVAGIDTMEYNRLIGALDHDIERARVEHERRERVEKVEQRRKILTHWQTGLQARKEQLAKYGGTTNVDVDAKLAEIAAELGRLETEGADQPANAPPPALSVAARQELTSLIDEVNKTVPELAERPYQERLALLRIWSARWRILALKSGEILVAREGVFKAGYAAIAQARDAVIPAERLDALSQHANPTISVWEGSVAGNIETLRALEAVRRKEESDARDAEVCVDELTAFISAVTPTTHEETRTLKHLVRQAARYEHLRSEVAELCGHYKDVLLPEFAFLWPEGEKSEEAEEPSATRLNMMDIAARICRRLKNKSMIGACHAPWLKVAKGFASHDYGRAEEAMEAMSKVGVLRKRRTGIGFRVSLEPSFMAAIDSLIAGRPSGVPALDAWLGVGVAVKSEVTVSPGMAKGSVT